ncbi:thiolase C-terminal domain-containing protein [Cumulibacter soli]|uniref:thiolase C-terminal domain-containing protein n=1 Tax=Cumulibacter soli TaxID=2546344 RepID=UPI0010689A8A|nr:thiolase [Cumulibacter soli]
MVGAHAAIVGASETASLGALPQMSVLELHAEAARAAAADAGISMSEIDGIATARPLPLDVAHYLGINARWIDGTAVGGTSFLLHVRHAAAAIAAGAANVVLISHGESGRSRVGALGAPDDSATPVGQFDKPYGAVTPYSTFTIPAMRFLHERGLGVDALASVVVEQRKWAIGNPRAARTKPVSIEDVLAAAPIAYPFTKDMCCVVTDGGGALIMTSAERAADLSPKSPPVYLLGAGEANGSPLVSQMPDLGSFEGFRRSSAEALAQAGIGTGDIDHFMGYDAFAHLPLYMLEDIGFVGRGESAAFVADGQTGRDGALPMNTNGGGLSYTHTGMYGMFAIQESVRQLRGTAFNQLPDIELSLVQGVGGFFWTSGTLVLSNRQP